MLAHIAYRVFQVSNSAAVAQVKSMPNAIVGTSRFPKTLKMRSNRHEDEKDRCDRGGHDAQTRRPNA